MKVKLPLFAKLILWFFLNLALLALLVLAFTGFRFPLAWEWMLSGSAGGQLQRTAALISSDLRSAPSGEWTDILGRFSSAYGVTFYIFRGDAEQLAGPVLQLPPEVREKLASRGFAGRARNPEGPGRQRPEAPPGEEGRPWRPGQGPRFVVRSGSPAQYWVGLPLALRPGERGGGPAMLLVASRSIDGGGLFFDWRPAATFSAAAVLLSILFWFPLVRGITRSIKQMSAATEEIARGRFDVSVSEARSDELGQLGASINSMTRRLEWFVTGQRRFLGDIAHELCSPIARVQMALGILEQRADERQKPYVDNLREEMEHMTSLVNELLAFSKASLGSKAAQIQTIALKPVIEEVIRREGDGAGLEVNLADNAVAKADPELLKRAVGNLLRNALRYAGSFGPITIEAKIDARETVIRVADEGPGIPPEHLTRVFEPFYRVDPARSAETGGVGLGLAIVKTCVEACGGSVKAANRKPKGLEVELRLPRA